MDVLFFGLIGLDKCVLDQFVLGELCFGRNDFGPIILEANFDIFGVKMKDLEFQTGVEEDSEKKERKRLFLRLLKSNLRDLIRKKKKNTKKTENQGVISSDVS